MAVAQHLGCEIVSADSRQIYRDIPIGTAAPNLAEMGGVTHHFVGTNALDQTVSAAVYADEVLALLTRLWEHNDYVILCGGSMLYIDAVTDGIARMPDVSEATRSRVADILATQGREGALAVLETYDPDAPASIDIANPRRIARALEIVMTTGLPLAQVHTGESASRPFKILKVAIDMPREQLFARINERVGSMMAAGLLAEARRVLPHRHLNSLNTVGYKELFDYFDGAIDLDEALRRIARNTRVYAKKQLTWLARPSVRPSIWLKDANADAVISLLNEKK